MIPYLKRAGRKSQAGADGSGFLLTDKCPMPRNQNTFTLDLQISVNNLRSEHNS